MTVPQGLVKGDLAEQTKTSETNGHEVTISQKLIVHIALNSCGIQDTV